MSARYEARKQFDQNRVISEDAASKIAQAEEVAKFLRENLVQGEAVDAEAEQYSRSYMRDEGESEGVEVEKLIVVQGYVYMSIRNGAIMRISRRLGRGLI
jgi:complex III assembly factor LYRM7